jgi:small GTP-binding protein
MVEEVKRMNVKVCLFGDAAVGKTSVIIRYVKNMFDEKYIATIGTNVYKKVVNVMHPDTKKPVEFTLMIWDIIGQKGFRELLRDEYFKGASAAIGVCDITRKETLDDLDEWRKSIVKVTGEIPIVFLANKCDLKDDAKFGKDELKNVLFKYIKSLGESNLRMMLLRAREPCLFTSAKTGENIELAFQTLCETML